MKWAEMNCAYYHGAAHPTHNVNDTFVNYNEVSIDPVSADAKDMKILKLEKMENYPLPSGTLLGAKHIQSGKVKVVIYDTYEMQTKFMGVTLRYLECFRSLEFQPYYNSIRVKSDQPVII
ncbi:hypothetical protein KGM_213023 [Danaus plexippus plexippus]|uniref:Uncharacterized protein n=1 Tax=Danaus plexippus plexippus TaxID=278856 RepID=A0A212EUP8_DANPL|nr:hypothetical protein KGM_213023 [Danaus plexippus plexippus]